MLDICRESPFSPHLRRWKVQRARRVVNVLFYLRTFSEWTNSQEVFTIFPELLEQASLAMALHSGVVNPILPFFGQGPAAFAELWHEYGNGPAALKAEKRLHDAKLNSLVLLRLHGTIKQSALPDLGVNDDSRLLLATSDISPKWRISPDLSFEDEFQSLRLGTSGEEISKFARTRHSIEEGAPLEALSLLGSEYFS